MSNKYLLSLISLILISLMTAAAFAGGRSDDKVWSEISGDALSRSPLERLVTPSDFRTFNLDKRALKNILDRAPQEFDPAVPDAPVILTMPMPNGEFARFRIEISPIMEPGLAAKFPEIKTYRGYGIDDPTASMRFDLMPGGFHSMILSPSGTVIIDPLYKDDTETYISYFKKNVRPRSEFVCEFDENMEFENISKAREFDAADFLGRNSAENVISGSQLRTYRLALAATNEYAVAVGGNTIAGTLAAQILVMNRVNAVYERELAIRMVTVANNNLVIYAGDNTCNGAPCTGANDPYTNNNGSTMLGENTTNLNAVIGSANYDIGHVFSTGGGGVATLNGPCGTNKARGVTGLSNPVGDPFAIDYVAHEMGHQWGSNHTFNGASGSCAGGNRSAANAYEPGSGVTIMAYAGICGNQNLSANSIDTFHVRSLEVIVAFSQTGSGNACAVTTATGNTPPSVSIVGPTSYNIPKQTPFSLTASATDVNNDSITYDWQQYDLGASTTAVPNTDSDGQPRPLFRPYLPSTSGTRFFPSIQYIRNNTNIPPSTTSGFLTGELLPAITRTMNFQVIARDNRADGGGINTATATVIVDGNSGPFDVTAPNTNVSWTGNSQQTVSWNVNNTTAAPVNAANVSIALSTDGGLTFPTVILASTPNDGSQTITVPNIATSGARIRVQGENNIFFDMSDVNFTITQGPAAVQKPPFDFDGDSKTDLSVFRPSNGSWWHFRSSDGGNRAENLGTATDVIAGADYTGDGRSDTALFRPSTGEWFVIRSENGTFFSFPFGAAGDIPAPGDYDGDGKVDYALFRPSNSTWFILRSTGGTTITTFGTAGDVPVAGDYDGDGKADIAIFRPSLGQWWINRSTAGVIVVNFGVSTDKTVQADYTGDGKTDVAFFRPSTNEWFVLRSENFSFYSGPFGAAGDLPVPGDYDGDAKADFAVFRPSANVWYLLRSSSGFTAVSFGAAGDRPLPNAYVR